MTINREQAECLAPTWIEIIGVDRLQEEGITSDDSSELDVDFADLGLSEDEGNAMYDTFGECDIDFRELFISSMTSRMTSSRARSSRIAWPTRSTKA